MKNILICISLLCLFVSIIAVFSCLTVSIISFLVATWIYILISDFDKVNIIIKIFVFVTTVCYLQELILNNIGE